MGFGSGVLLLVALGFLVLGPKRMHEVMQQLGKAKGEFDRSSREIKARLAAEIEGSANAGSTSAPK